MAISTNKTNMRNNFIEYLGLHSDVMQRLIELENHIAAAVDVIADYLDKDCKVLVCGNGGSAADCQHIAAECTGRFRKDRRPLAAIALTTDASALTRIANDYEFDDLFIRQVIAIGRLGDCLLEILTSGNARNVIRAIEAANKVGIPTLGLLGRAGGLLRARCKSSIVVPSEVIACIQGATS